MNVPIYSSHNPVLSLWQSAVHAVLSQNSALANSTHAGLGVTAATPEMRATAAVMSNFDSTGTFDVSSEVQGVGAAMTAVAGQVAQAAGAPASAPPSVTMQCASLAAQIAYNTVRNPARAALLKQEFLAGTCDPLWADCIVQFEKWQISGQGQPYTNWTNIGDFVIEQCFPDNATIAIIGDWGTGMNAALILLQQIAANFKPDVLIHLGDIYYSGLPSECKTHFTDLIDQAWPPGGPRPLVFTLDGNHDRYSGSNGGYYSLIASLNEDAGKPQPNSYFALRNNSWQFVAMDTGLNDSDPNTEAGNVTWLVPQEVDWIVDKVSNAGASVDTTRNPGGTRGTVLLSHHQLYSFTGIGKAPNGAQMAVNQRLVNALSPIFNKVDMWLWGHEHWLCIFEPYTNGPGQPLPKGRCVGASAVPTYLAQKPVPPPNLVLPEGVNTPPQVVGGTMLGNNGTVFNYCYAVMQLTGPSMSIAYYQVDSTDATPGNPPPLGEPLYTESIDKPVAAQ